MIYLASPYSHPDPAIMHSRFLSAERATAALLARREWIYSPIVHCHELARKHSLPTDFAFWRDYNFAVLRHCQLLYVLDLEGWDTSKGVAREFAFAKQAGIPAYLVNEKGNLITLLQDW